MHRAQGAGDGSAQNLGGGDQTANVNISLRLTRARQRGSLQHGCFGMPPAPLPVKQPTGRIPVPKRDSPAGKAAAGAGVVMKHAASRELYTYWQELRGRRPAPERAEIEPAAIRGILSETFIVALDRTEGYPFRLAGTRVCALFDRELKGESFLTLWDDTSRRTIADLLGILADEWVGTVAGVTAHNTEGEAFDFELLLLPLSATRPALQRGIGILAPLRTLPTIGTTPLGPLTLGSRRHIGPAIEKRLLPRILTPLGNRRGLVVHDGGRS
jgi:hypothetical protein